MKKNLSINQIKLDKMYILELFRAEMRKKSKNIDIFLLC